jgi:hypothetical protein
MDQDKIDVIIESFFAVKDIAEEELRSNAATTNPDLLYKTWRQINKSPEVSSVVFGQHGEFVFISASLNKTIIIRPVLNQGLSWQCSIVPAVSHKTLCAHFPIKIEAKK